MSRDALSAIPGYPTCDHRRAYSTAKRAMDLALAITLSIAVLPLVLLIASLIKLDSAGPIFFSQIRVGRGGRPFLLHKFRTMEQAADPGLHRWYMQSLIKNELVDSERCDLCGASAYKLADDPRVTRVGALLRRSSLDELPQLLNVILGDMSLVGPRPALPYEVEHYQEWHMARLATMPGITGWWQVKARSRVPFDEMVRLDLEYISKQSLWLDSWILLLTIPAVISGDGAR